MRTKAQSIEIWETLNRKQELLTNLGLGDALPITKDIAICILANSGIILEDIIRTPYFAGVSRSTIKRAVGLLVSTGYVEFVRDTKDLRSNLLTFKEK